MAMALLNPAAGRAKITGNSYKPNKLPAKYGRPVLLRHRMTTVAPRAISSPPERADKPVEKKKPVLYVTTSIDEDYTDEECQLFVDRDGEFVKTLCCDYGFRSGAGRMYQGESGRIPDSAWVLAGNNFQQELKALRRSFRYDEYRAFEEAGPEPGIVGKVLGAVGNLIVRGAAGLDKALEQSSVLPTLKPKKTIEEKLAESESRKELTSECREIRRKLKQLTLSNAAVWERERTREATGGAVETPWVVKAVYLSLCVFLDAMYENRPVQRFWFLEVVARMPYFSYITMLHLYESFGWWRAGAELRKVHFAEEWNEMHHLQIMETLGGDQLWLDRFLAQHAAIVYYWILVALFVFSPQLAYNFSELIEAHAVDTYGQFKDENAAILRELPPPLVAVQYYRSNDLYMFDEFQTAEKREPRRPSCNNLYDVFSNICDDEGEHVKTMKACQDNSIEGELEKRGETNRRA